MNQDTLTHYLAAEALAEQVCSTLGSRSQRLVTAESCTGGLMASFLTGVAGSSQCFERGFVTYSNQAKCDLLAVPASVLEEYGAVSQQNASAMAMGALRHSQSQWAVSITGIAGPGGGSDQKPVGTVMFAWARIGFAATTAEQHFLGDRQLVRLQAVEFAFTELLEQLQQAK